MYSHGAMEVHGVVMVVNLQSVFRMCMVGNFFCFRNDWCMGRYFVLSCDMMTDCENGSNHDCTRAYCSGGVG